MNFQMMKLDKILDRQMRKALLSELRDIVNDDMFHKVSEEGELLPSMKKLLEIDKHRNRANQLATIIYDLPEAHNGPLDSIEDAVYLVKKVAPNMSWWTVEWNNCQGHWAEIKVDVRIGNKNEVQGYYGYNVSGAASLIQSLIKYLDDKPRLNDLHEAALKKGERELENASN